MDLIFIFQDIFKRSLLPQSGVSFIRPFFLDIHRLINLSFVKVFTWRRSILRYALVHTLISLEIVAVKYLIDLIEVDF